MIDSVLEKLKLELKKKHKELMKMVPKNERDALMAELDKKIKSAKIESDNDPIMNDFIKEVYNK